MPIEPEDEGYILAAIKLEEEFPEIRADITDQKKRHSFLVAVAKNDMNAAIDALGYTSRTLAKTQGKILFDKCNNKGHELGMW